MPSVRFKVKKIYLHQHICKTGKVNTKISELKSELLNTYIISNTNIGSSKSYIEGISHNIMKFNINSSLFHSFIHTGQK